MKKGLLIISLVLVIVCVLSFSAFAEDETVLETEVESAEVETEKETTTGVASEEELTFVEEYEGKLKFDMDKLIATIITFLAANLATIIGFAIKMIKTKVDAQNLKNAYDKQVLDLTQKYNEQLDAYSLSINAKLDALDKHIVDRIDTTEQLRELAVKQDTVQLQETIDALKNSLKV